MNEGDSEFSFLDNSARPQAESIRSFCENIFSRYPSRSDYRARDRNELRQRFADKNNAGHNSAFWELLLHEFFLKLGYEVEIHPSLQGTNDRPDFRIHTTDGHSLIVEAVCQMPQHETNQGAVRRLVEVRNALNRFQQFPQWGFMVSYSGLPDSQIATTRLIRELSDWLPVFDPPATTDDAYSDEDDGRHRFVFKQNEWTLHIRPIAVQGIGGRRVASWGPKEAYFDNTIKRARETVDRKASKYGKLPMVIALNINDPFVEQEDIESLLYGPILVNFCRGANGTEWTDSYRGNDGLFVRRQQPTNQNIIGILLSNCTSWSVQNRRISLHLNPFGPLPQPEFEATFGAMCRLPRSCIEAQCKIVHKDGDDLRKVLQWQPPA